MPAELDADKLERQAKEKIDSIEPEPSVPIDSVAPTIVPMPVKRKRGRPPLSDAEKAARKAAKSAAQNAPLPPSVEVPDPKPEPNRPVPPTLVPPGFKTDSPWNVSKDVEALSITLARVADGLIDLIASRMNVKVSKSEESAIQALGHSIKHYVQNEVNTSDKVTPESVAIIGIVAFAAGKIGANIGDLANADKPKS